MTDREAHVVMLRLSEVQRLNILRCARAIRDAKGDRKKWHKSVKNFRTCLEYYKVLGVLSGEEADGIYTTFCVNGI